MSKNYELMMVVKPDFDVSSEAKAKELLEKLLGKEVKITEISLMGKKTMAYPIRKFTEANYFVAKLNGVVRIDLFEKLVKLNEVVLRYLLLGR